MLLVNNIALDTATPRHLTHAPWNSGVHFADLVFPWFLLIVGVAIPFAASSHRKRNLSQWRFIWKALERAATLVALGWLVDSSVARTPTVGLGVLQIIGLAYLVGAILYRLPGVWRAAAAAALLIAHWALIRFLPMPGIEAGTFTESQNAIRYLDSLYLAPYHLKGLLSVVPTSALVLIGGLLGDMLRGEHSAMRKAAYLIGSGIVLGLLGWLWSLDLPFNKPVWTASYILYTAGLGAIVLGLLYLIIDARGWRWWAFPLIVFGMNAIFAYVAPILVKVFILQTWTVGSPPVSLQQAYMQWLAVRSGGMAGWIYTATYIGVWWMVLLEMYRRRMFLRV